MRYRFYTCDVFTEKIFGGNPLAVFPDAEGLSTEQMQAIAKEFNLSETVFVLPPRQSAHQFKFRIFTPSAELPFAGHPTVGAAHLLASLGQIDLKNTSTTVVVEEGLGDIPIVIKSENQQPYFVQFSAAQMPQYVQPVPRVADIAATLSLETEAVLNETDWPCVLNCGIAFLLVPLASLEAIQKIQINSARWNQTMESGLIGMYVFVREGTLNASHLHARMFAPEAGIPEDPATGSAATALAGYLGDVEKFKGTRKWTIEQGFEMGRPSLIEVEADRENNQTVAIRVGGNAVMVSEGTMAVPAGGDS